MEAADKAFLVLADGTVFEGKSIGASGSTIGETVFTTGMTGYIETLTDPSYYGQIVTQTFPLIGNYGVIPEDFESRKSFVRGYVVRELCDLPSNFRCESDLSSFLKAQGIIGICGIDTRALTKKLREAGVMNGMIISGKSAVDFVPTAQLLEKIKDYKITDAVKIVNIKEEGEGSPSLQPALQSSATHSSGGSPRNAPHVILFDFGAKYNIQRELEKRGCAVTVVPYNTTAEEVINQNPDGIMLSNGPGDPAENIGVISEIKKLCDYGKIPIFGICLGHQMLALARGAKTSKLKYGHRGGNHPVKDTATNRVYITSQNHGYAVDASTLGNDWRELFVNMNDGSNEGIRHLSHPWFSSQFHPEACSGPVDTEFMFDRFIETL